MNALFLDFGAARLRLTCAAPAVLEGLARDFAYFRREAGGAPDVALELEARAPGSWAQGGLPLWRAPGYTALSRAGGRLIRYDDGAAAFYDHAARRGRLACPRPARLQELAYLAVLSRAGEALDLAGWHRAHALGFSWRGQGALLLLPSGGGKTTLALRLLGMPSARLLSDETPLVDAAGTLRAFPLRLGLRPGADVDAVPERWRRPVERARHGPKTAVDLPYFEARLGERAPARWLLLGRRTGGPPSLRPAGAAETAAALGVGLVAGWGAAQMAEYMVRPSPAGAALLGRIAAARARAAWNLARRCERWSFELGDDPAAAAGALERFLDGAAVTAAR